VNFSSKRAVLWLRQSLVTHRGTRSDYKLVPVWFVVDQEGLGQGFVFPVTTISPVLHTHLHLHVALTRRAKRRSLSTLQRVRDFFSEIRGHWKQMYFFSALKDYSKQRNVARFPQIAWCLLTHPPNMFELKHTFSKYGISIPTACWPRALFT